LNLCRGKWRRLAGLLQGLSQLVRTPPRC
jgi:hypothetical protein